MRPVKCGHCGNLFELTELRICPKCGSSNFREITDADTMSMAIEMSSPSGRVSKRASKAASKRLAFAMWGAEGLPKPTTKQPTKYETLMRQAREFRELASRGM